MKFAFPAYRIGSIFVCLLVSYSFLGCNQSSNDSASQPEGTSPRYPESHFSDSTDILTNHVYVYECEQEVRFSAYVTSDSVRLFLPDTTALLHPARSASGARYTNQDLVYWSTGSKAMLETSSRSFKECSSLPQEKAWEAARLRGVYFRALGQEPGWTLEIKKKGELTYLGRYGQDTLSIPAPEPQKQNGKTLYEVTSDTTPTLKVEITEERCTGAMSGFQHPYEVAITVGEESYQGCGRYLQ